MNKTSKAILQVWRLALPLLLSNITVPLLGIIDTAVVGHLQHAYYIGAVAMGSMIINMIFWSLNFLRQSSSGLIAQAFGRRDNHAIKQVFAQSLFLAFVLSLILLLLKPIILQVAIYILKPTPNVSYYTKEYFNICIWGTIAILGNAVIRGFYIGFHKMFYPMLLMILINVLGMGLDILFVYGFHYDVAGVAYATIIAQYFGLFLGLYFVYKTMSTLPEKINLVSIFDYAQLKKLLVLNNNIFLRTICLVLVYGFFTKWSAQFGAVVLAANAILLNFQYLMSYALDGFANATEAMVGRAIGQKSKDEVMLAIKGSTFWALVIALGFTLVYFFFGKLFISWMTSVPSVYVTAIHYLPWIMVLPLCCVWSFLLDGIFIGAMMAKQMRNTMLLSTGLFFFPIWYLTIPIGNHGLWLAFLSYMLGRALTMIVSLIAEKNKCQLFISRGAAC